MDQRTSRRMRARLLAATLGFVLAAGAGAIASPSPAFAIPPGGWCYTSWITGVTNHGETFDALPGTTSSFTNDSNQVATWTRTRTESTTFRTTATSTRTFTGGLDLGVITIGVNQTTTTTVVRQHTITETDSFSVPVPPGIRLFSAYGTWKLHSTFTYHQRRVGCQNGDFPEEFSAPAEAFLVVNDGNHAPGWRIWQ